MLNPRTRRRGTAPVIRWLIGSQVAGDHSGVVTDLVGAPSATTDPFETIHTIADAQNKRRIMLIKVTMHRAGAERYNERTECLGIALRQSGNGLVGHGAGAFGKEAGEFSVRRVPVDRSPV